MDSARIIKSTTEMALGAAHAPDGHRPWEDQRISAEERYKSYYDVAYAKVVEISRAYKRSEISALEQKQIREGPETRFWMDELQQLQRESAEGFCQRIDGRPQRELLGSNFLGAEEWQSLGVDIGAVPPIPVTVTEALLNSECPLCPGEKIKDTHLLALVPKTVNEEPYSALKLNELCAGRKGSGDRLIYDEEEWGARWKSRPWASIPQAQSEWVLIPKSDADPAKAADEQHFRSKSVDRQKIVHDKQYPEYREAVILELMTALLLNDLVNGWPRPLDGWNALRCLEQKTSDTSVCAGSFDTNGLWISYVYGVGGHAGVGRALARKL